MKIKWTLTIHNFNLAAATKFNYLKQPTTITWKASPHGGSGFTLK